MPELPDLEVICEILNRQVVGRRIVGVPLLRPIVVRLLEADTSAEEYLVGRQIVSAHRHGKMVVLPLDPIGYVAINPMLVGKLRRCDAAGRVLKRDYLAIDLDDGSQLRYNDTKAMGKVYLTDDLNPIPGYGDIGPDPLSPDLGLAAFRERLRHFRGEIKGILTRGALVNGIGNAYADEILFRAGIYPFRKRPSLNAVEEQALYDAMRDVLSESLSIVRERMGDRMDLKIRDFLAVHNKKGEPCPRCGSAISEIKVRRRATDFCRQCQPGSMFG